MGTGRATDKVINIDKKRIKLEMEKITGMFAKKNNAVIFAVLVLIAVISVTCGRLSSVHMDAYVAGTSNDAAVYLIGKPLPAEKNTEEVSEEAAEESAGEPADTNSVTAREIDRLVRGTPVYRTNRTVEIDGVRYVAIGNKEAMIPSEEAPDILSKVPKYIREDNLAASPKDIVKETEVYVRTPVTIYAEETGPAIASFAPKSTCLKVTGYDNIDTNGYVNKYKVEYQDGDSVAEGYVYGKYMTDTQEKADAVFNDNGVYDNAEDDKYGIDLHGGEACHLDYYPYERPVFEGNEFCAQARAMYLNCAAAVQPENYIKIIEETDCNAVVVDIKDGVLAYESETAKELSPRSYKTAYASVEDYKEGIDALRETGVYLIGRIVVFNDPIYGKDHPDECIVYGSNTEWPSAYSRSAWEYNVRLAQEAIKEFGFNEIQFDYVRFPENTYTMSGSGAADFRNKYGEEKGQAVQNFCFYAADQIHEAGAYFSVDVFGESAYGYMTAYGQYWPGISNIVDAISAMPYTDHTGGPDAWTDPYGTMYSWAKRAKKKQDMLLSPAAARTWITGYNTPYWSPTVNYGEAELKAQIKGLEDAGLDGGFIPWNVTNNIEKYNEYKAIWNK